jgi:hypothetical protein
LDKKRGQRHFRSHFAGVLENRIATPVKVFREPHPLSPRRDFLQFCFALFKGMLAVILTIQFQQVKGIQEDLVIMGMQSVEIGLAILPSPNRLLIHDDGADPKGSQRLDLPRNAFGLPQLFRSLQYFVSLKKNPTRNAQVATQDSIPFARSIPLRGVRCSSSCCIASSAQRPRCADIR